MPRFRYTVRNRQGMAQTGVTVAASRDDLIALLRRQGLLPLTVAEDRETSLGDRLRSLNPLEYRSMNSVDVAQNFHHIAMMFKSGVSLLEAVDLIAEHSRLSVQRIWRRVSARIRQGSSIADALAEHKVFTQLSIQLVRVGEKTGHLDRALQHASTELEEQRKIRAQLIGALLYPCFVLLFAIGVTVFMLVKIIPELQKFLSIMGRKLPPMTQALIDASEWFQAYTPSIAATLAASAGVLIVLYRWPPGRLALDTLMLRLPVFGRIFRLSGTVVFARAMEALLRSGVHILEALETVEGLHRNRYLAQCLAQARKRVAEGAPLSESLAARFGYMPMLARMMAIGENAGRLDEMLGEMGTFHQELLAKDIRRMSGMIAPALTVIVGGIIGFVYAAFLTAMFAAGGGSPQ